MLSEGRQLSKRDQLPSNMHYRLLELSKNVTFWSPGVSQPFNLDVNIHQYLSCSRHEPYSVPATVDPRSQPRHVELEVSILDLLLKLIAATSFGMVPNLRYYKL